jgi:phosphatidate cytidylyltransferase
MSNTAIRILVAIIGIPCIVAVCLLGGFWIWGMVAILATVGILELYHLLEKKGAKPLVAEGVVAGIVITLAFEYHRILEFAPFSYFAHNAISLFPSGFHLIVVILILFILWAFIHELFRNDGSAVLNLTATVFGVLYVPLFLGTFIGINELFSKENPMMRFTGYDANVIERYGGTTLLTIFAVIWICDSAAYFGGHATGRHKLFERVSPKKTWEGAIWGLAGAVVASIGARYLMLHFLTLGESIVIGVIVGVIGQVGDLAESLLKRDAGEKDSSTIIPGHGGILDRFDSLLFVSPVLFLYLNTILIRQ